MFSRWSSVQLSIYDSWFDPVLKTLPTLVPNGFIYLRAGPDTCHRRMKMRARSEEGTVGLDYLQVHTMHGGQWVGCTGGCNGCGPRKGP